jgi:alpha-galactosidase
LNFDRIGLKGRFQVRDLWRQEDLGFYKNTFTAEVPYHGVKLVRLIPDKLAH